MMQQCHYRRLKRWSDSRVTFARCDSRSAKFQTIGSTTSTLEASGSSVACFERRGRMVGDKFSDAMFAELLQRIVPFVPSSTQSWRPDTEPVVPELPSDPVSGMAATNPYARDDEPALASRQVLETKNP